MKKRLNPTEILLKELPPEGRVYEYNHDSGELTQSIQDLIDDSGYNVSLTVRPIGNAYSVEGEVQTNLKLQCSLCAIDFNNPIRQKFNEVLVIHQALNKGDQNTKTNHSSEWNMDQPAGIYLESPIFDVRAFIRELIALAEPIRPLGRPDCDVRCENRPPMIQREWLTIDSNSREPVKNNPFSVLEKMKLKS